MSYIEGTPRNQSSLFPESLEDFVPEDHPVRVIDAFIERLDMAGQGFTGAQNQIMGRPRYRPQELLKLYIYGYLNQIRSSRKLERECLRNVELMWLLKRLAPDFKTIADFRKDNPVALKRTCRAFILFCKEAGLLGDEVAIDGSKFRAAASRDQVFTKKSLQQQLARIDDQIASYLEQLDQTDTSDPVLDVSTQQVQAALERLQHEQTQLHQDQEAMEQAKKSQHCRTEPDAHLMRSGRQGIVRGYNIQNAVDTTHKLIIHHRVSQNSSDGGELYRMARMTQVTLRANRLKVLADTGYSSGAQLARCDKHRIQASVPLNRAINNQNQGQHYQKRDFDYDEAKDVYHCPAGQTLSYKTCNRKMRMLLYTTDSCRDCQLKPACTTGKQRWLSRHFNEDAFDRSLERLSRDPRAMTRRQACVEAPFATIKRMMGDGRFICRGLSSVKSEVALSTLAYNLKRLMNIMGNQAIIQKLVSG